MNGTVKRSIFGLLFLAVMLGGLLYHEYAFGILFLFISFQMLLEFYRINLGDSMRFLQTAGLIVGNILFLLGFFYFRGDASLSLFVGGGVGLLLLLLCQSVLQINHQDFPKFAFILAGLLYVSLPLALSPALVFTEGSFSGLLLVAFFCIIWASDVGAYCLGMLFGQKIWPAKMCPSISPKKSWAGFIGGLLFACLAGAVLKWTGLLALSMFHCVVMAAVMHVFGVFGDLFESLWKRAAGIKDSGNVIPGHGGLLDRFDSALFAIPAACIYLAIIGL
ncbi:MAG: phosphatidate cytidylyltransferase [Bacteroidales bacterium]|nr:phosphatidate cytidylyltransferase [Bacteroidales bacterium]